VVTRLLHIPSRSATGTCASCCRQRQPNISGRRHMTCQHNQIFYSNPPNADNCGTATALQVLVCGTTASPTQPQTPCATCTLQPSVSLVIALQVLACGTTASSTQSQIPCISCHVQSTATIHKRSHFKCLQALECGTTGSSTPSQTPCATCNLQASVSLVTALQALRCGTMGSSTQSQIPCVILWMACCH
jgi:hypothetical protein